MSCTLNKNYFSSHTPSKHNHKKKSSKENLKQSKYFLVIDNHIVNFES